MFGALLVIASGNRQQCEMQYLVLHVVACTSDTTLPAGVPTEYSVHPCLCTTATTTTHT